MCDVISVQNLTFAYPESAVPVLKDINLKIKPGEFVTITGLSGCGKSTLSLCLAGFIPHSIAGVMEGRVLINGLDTREYSPARLAGNIGLVQQDPEAQLCTLKVLDEVAFGPENLCLSRPEIASRVEWALTAVNLWHLRDREVYNLSGGEKQRLAIAAVLAMQPAVIVLDEPTANLDPGSTAEVLQVIQKLKEEADTAVVVIEHRLKRLLPWSDRLIVMDKGRIAADGKPEEVYADYQNGLTPKSAAKRGNRENPTRPILRVDNVTLNYGSVPILSEISFSLYPGEIIAVMGDNGSGKTSLLLALLGINRVKSGKIYLHNRDITNQKVAQRARRMGMVFQNPNHQIFENSVFREAHLPSRLLMAEPDIANTEQVLADFNLLHYRDQLPFALSLGEKKRLTLVSVLAYNPDILILDEPLVGQDEYRLSVFWDAVRMHSEWGGGTIMVCHEPDFVASFCDRVIFLQQGKILIDSPVDMAFEQLLALGFTEYVPEGF